MLTSDETSRYSRQLILPEIGVAGQMKMKNSSVLIVGCGGLGCPAAQYLAAGGVGRIGLVDGDVVERSNLHRQILHREERVGMKKTESIVDSLKTLNSNVSFSEIRERLSRENALDIVKDFDLVIDATDNAMARYLLSDVCVLSRKPLVSGAALRFEGQLTVYNYDETTPCFRCIFPNPPPPETVTSCTDGGVLGVVPGIIGSLLALEAIKIMVGIRPSFAGQMLLFDGMGGTFRTIRIRNRRKNCVSCGEKATIDENLIDYEKFVSAPICAPSGNTLKILLPFERISCKEYKQVLDSNINHVLIDVRPEVEADIVKLEHAINIPLKELSTEDGFRRLHQVMEMKKTRNVFVMCRRGNASQKAVRIIKDRLSLQEQEQKTVRMEDSSSLDEQDVRDIIGGITAWSEEVDPSLPTY